MLCYPSVSCARVACMSGWLDGWLAGSFAYCGRAAALQAIFFYAYIPCVYLSCGPIPTHAHARTHSCCDFTSLVFLAHRAAKNMEDRKKPANKKEEEEEKEKAEKEQL